jgi:hypothetical protein
MSLRNVALRRLELLCAIEKHWQLFDSPPSLAGCERLLRRSYVSMLGKLRRDRCVAPTELRLTAAGIRELYSTEYIWRRHAA